ncbi:hypothetical protein CROQUDRAFT_674446 [Cronartium quercuum f. sp. fusiforme G11]|uniref:Cytochrome c oxidase assembly factor 3 n=1 Tax=Cronartium quercuum f. sp. fusiforme G11 TaxID=708437 RepID=A0A9P6T7U3_9BASI|nr:hypothetical protein CROQUDRAFT_674446 [Cronartium quercuum f. sp. fusiforme G11]
MSTLNHREKRETYWSSGRMSPGLQRARQPFRAKNLITGAGILSFTFAVYAYSISAVKQDDFSDIPAPTPEEIRRLNEAKQPLPLAPEQVLPPPVAQTPPLGLLGSATSWIRAGRVSQSEIVVGAPPLDRLGQLADRRPIETEKKLV